MDAPQQTLFDDTAPAGHAQQPVVLSYGLGVDSTAILLRWLTDPTSRDFDLDQLTVVTAMTGDEWPQTGVDVRDHVLPLLRRHQVRYVQVARGGRSAAVDGVTVLSDTRNPNELHLAGDYTLSQEMLATGTIPQAGGVRKCSIRSKAEPLEHTISQVTGGRPYRHVLGFEAGEPTRAAKDATYNTSLRTGEYPLVEWGWDRQACIDFIRGVTGVTWTKSACSYCVFAMTNKAGRAATLTKYADSPNIGAGALFMEHVALALNPAQGLIAGERAVDAVREAGHQHVIDALEEQLAGTEHAIYEVRRILRPRAGDVTKLGNASRSVRRLATGSRDALDNELKRLAQHRQLELETTDDGHTRAWAHRRSTSFPTREQFLVVAPAVVDNKQLPKFESWWADLDAEAELEGTLLAAS